MVPSGSDKASLRSPEHPLYKPVRSSTSRYTKRHRTAIHALFSRYSDDHRPIETIPSKPRNPAHLSKLPFTVNIPPNKEASIDEALRACEKVKVYSDGSAFNGKVGAAAVLTRADKPHRILHYHLGPDSKHTVHEAELLGLLLALHLVETERPGCTSFVIGVDHQAALTAFNSDMR